MIKNGAVLVESLEDIVWEFGHYGRDTMPANPSRTPESENPHNWFLDHMGYAPCTRDDLVTRSGLTSAEVSSMLLALELGGCVELCPGGTYVRVTRS